MSSRDTFSASRGAQKAVGLRGTGDLGSNKSGDVIDGNSS
jgi:hypothetical protein